MGTTRTTTATTTTPTIIFTEDQLNPYATHAPTHLPTRHRPTGPALPGLPGPGGPLTLRTTHPGRPRAGAPGNRPTALLDGVGAEIPATFLLHDHPGLTPARPLAPSLGELVRLATAVDELAALHGQFASYAGRLGPRSAVQAGRALLAAFETAAADADRARHANAVSGGPGSAGATALLWQLAAVIRPLAPAAGRCTASGLALDLPARFLGEEFGPRAVVRFDDVDCPPALAHAPTRRFLRERGLPENAVPFALETDTPLRTLAEHAADAGHGDALPQRRLPAGAERLIRLGGLTADADLVLDGATGAVLIRSEPDLGLHPLNADISTLALTFGLIRREGALHAVRTLTGAYDRLADTMCRTLSATDPAACHADVG
ncbi:SUKH-4 family immunity protein [Streptomyces hilarionis]|uniref:SUKH-4 family immunity protein n=1 Tax=Streptomyces hilarionis TaxID=2839954 RepID=UPI00211A02E1|nr:SUKH-4 family immunity protein [Streptomyces hilarionis]MCQ9134317.1 SUKH-4 family immunity protein [Streptomyces hilarionis]